MSISVEEILEALNYASVSPFVKKMQGDRYRKEEAQIASDIYESSAMLGTVKKEHENVLAVLSEASKNSEQYEREVIEHISKERDDLEKRAEKAQKDFDAVPKMDEAFIASCFKDLRAINAQKQAKEKEIRKKFEKKFETDKKSRKNTLKFCAFAIMLGIISLLLLILYYDPYGSSAFFLLTITGICTGVFFLIIALLIYFFGKPKSVLEDDIQREIDKAIPNYERIVEQINENMKVGYDKNSEFYRAIISAEMKLEMELFVTKGLIEYNADILMMCNNGFQNGVLLLQKTIDNIEPLNIWAANYLRDQVQREHNEKMLSIEEERLHEQRVANQVQKHAIWKQNQLLERQAAAAEQQAKDAKEIRRRMENERYGEYWKSSNN